MKKLIAITMVTFGLMVGFDLATQQASAYSWHSGTPSFAKGYWHTRGRGSVTFHVFKNHVWFRYSGWSRYGSRKWRAPWHGYDHTRFAYKVKSAALVYVDNQQDGQWLYLGVEKISQNHIRLFTQKSIKGGMVYFYKPENLYRGIK